MWRGRNYDRFNVVRERAKSAVDLYISLRIYWKTIFINNFNNIIYSGWIWVGFWHIKWTIIYITLWESVWQHQNSIYIHLWYNINFLRQNKMSSLSTIWLCYFCIDIYDTKMIICIYNMKYKVLLYSIHNWVVVD